jgi:hypothetical protein
VQVASLRMVRRSLSLCHRFLRRVVGAVVAFALTMVFGLAGMKVSADPESASSATWPGAASKLPARCRAPPRNPASTTIRAASREGELARLTVDIREAGPGRANFPDGRTCVTDRIRTPTLSDIWPVTRVCHVARMGITMPTADRLRSEPTDLKD